MATIPDEQLLVHELEHADLALVFRELREHRQRQWWQLHPTARGVSINEIGFILKILGKCREVEDDIFKYSCPIHQRKGRLECVATSDSWSCDCTGERIDWEPLQFLAAYRKCSLEEALVELCKLIPPSKDGQ